MPQPARSFRTSCRSVPRPLSHRSLLRFITDRAIASYAARNPEFSRHETAPPLRRKTGLKQTIPTVYPFHLHWSPSPSLVFHFPTIREGRLAIAVTIHTHLITTRRVHNQARVLPENSGMPVRRPREINSQLPTRGLCRSFISYRHI